ncbi:MAG: hypothetical protein H6953_11985 [Chromatiaceae bacterium]|nr:hypothetical protein [Chromatiaceae bacterium]MCP5315932.1 hypothetical protein [Chromatiaceae bacterium]
MALSAEEWLAVWERGRTRHPLDRALLLFSLASPELPTDALADQPVGRLNASLLAFRRAEFGHVLAAYLDCPACSERLEFELDVAALSDTDWRGEREVEVDGWRFRVPTLRDLAAIADDADAATAAQRLFLACGEAMAIAPPSSQPARPDMLRVEAALEAADPGADIMLAVQCDACGHAWQAPFDIAGLLWEEIETRAERLLDDVDRLARAYGWSEAQILALSDTRRGAYLDRVSL